MKNGLLTLLLTALLCTCGRAQTYEVNVHPGQELMTIIQILAEKYPDPNASNYQADFEKHFLPFAKHAAVEQLRSIPGKVYTDLPEMGWCFSDFPNFKLHLPEENSWYELYGKDTVQQALRLAIDFAKDSDFWSFYQAHQPDYQRWAKEVEHTLDSLSYVRLLDEFYRGSGAAGPKPTFYIALDPLNSWGAHAIPGLAEINPYYDKYKAYSLGYWNRRSTVKDSPSFSGSSFLSDLVWHEGSHIYLNELLEGKEELIESISHLYNGDERKMKRQSIDTWQYCFEENLVRGVVIALTKQHRSHRQYREQNADELLSGFIYAEDIAGWLERYYLKAENERPLGEFLPDLIEWLGEQYVGVPK